MTLMLRTSLALFSLVAILACETADDNNIEQARQCLNNAALVATGNPPQVSTAATIARSTCEPFIANVQSSEAGSIGVGIVLVEEGKLSSLTSIQTAVSNGTSAVTTSIAFLVFQTVSDVTNITTYAQRSGDTNEIQLAAIVTLAYYVNIAASGGLSSSSTPAQVSGYLSTLSTDPVNGPPAAAALLSAQQNACAGSGSTSTLCTDLTNAVGTNTSSYGAILSNASTYVGSGG
jgi:hypothetical protein